MMLLRPLAAPFLAVAVLVFFASCTADDGPTGDAPRALLDLPRPNPDTMATDVAALIDERWNELNAALAVADATPAAFAEAYATYGLACFGNGLVIPAEAAFLNATRLAPDEARWIYFLALVHQFTGTLDSAAAGLERVLALRPGDLPALIRLGDVRLEQARIDEAQTAYRLALDVDPDSAAAHYGLGRMANGEGEILVAVGHYEAALEQQPYADRLNYLLGLAWRDLGDEDKARAYLARRGVTDPSYADPLFDEISGGRARIEGLWGQMNAGSQAYVDGNYELAVEKFRAATRDHPDDSRSWQSLGMALNKTGDRGSAESAYLRSLEIAENNAVVHHDLAELLIGDGRLVAAERHLLRAVVIDPRKIDAHATLARLLTKLGRTAEALRQYDEALALDPQSGTLAVSRAEVLVGLGRSADALVALAEAARVNSLDATVRTAYGMMLADAGQVDEAMTEIEQALAVAEDDAGRARAYYAFGRVHIMRDDGLKAISSFETALELNPDHRAARLDLARTLVRSRRYEQALSTYEALITRWPDDQATRLEAAGGAVLLGHSAYARRLLEAGAVKETASPRLLSALARLLALSPDLEVRDPDRALEYAQLAFEKSRVSQHAETVALCLAAVGRFDEAVRLQERLLTDAQQRGGVAEQARLTENLERYRARGLGRLPLDTA